MNPKPNLYDWNAQSIRALRRYMSLSQQAMSAELGVRQQTISEWETGVYKPRGGMITLLSLVAERIGYPAESDPEPHDWEKQPIITLGLKPRATTALQNANLHTVGDILALWSKGKSHLLAIPDFGPSSLKALEAKLRKLGVLY